MDYYLEFQMLTSKIEDAEQQLNNVNKKLATISCQLEIRNKILAIQDEIITWYKEILKKEEEIEELKRLLGK